MSIQNKALIASCFEEIWNNRNYDYANQVFAPDHINHDLPCEYPHGPAGLRQFAEMFHTAFPNLWMRIDFQLTDGDLVVTRWTCGGSNTGEFMGMEPTYHNVEITGTQIDRIEQGKIVESWGNYDLYGLFEQMELVPTKH